MKTKISFLFCVLLVQSLFWATISFSQNNKSVQKTNNESVSKSADYVFKNGVIYTIDSQNPKAEAIAVTGKTISFVGNNKGVVNYVGNNTKVIDLNGQMLLPGFVESHIHPSMAILSIGADLQTDSMDELLSRVKAWSDENPNAKVIRGFAWRYTMFPITGPTKDVLDKLFPDKPVFLLAIDCHSAWVNSKALALAGIDAKHPDPLPGVSYFQRDPKTNEPTGWVVETLAEQEMFAKLNLMAPDMIMKEIKNLLPKLSAAGITSNFDAGIAIIPTEKVLQEYQKMEQVNKMPIRVVASYFWNNASILDPVEKALALKRKFNSELVKLNTLKILMDGGEAQHTAVMLQPYADRAGFYGDFSIDKKLVAAAILKAESNNLNTHCHCYGDSATRTYLNAIEAAQNTYPKSVSRHAASHVIFLSPKDAPRFAKLNVTMQSSAQWATPDPTIRRSAHIVGEDIAYKEFFLHNSVLKAGGRLALGSDWPAAGYVSTYNPLDAIQVAVTRDILHKYGKDQFAPVLPPADERITLDQALKAATLDAAYVLGLENIVGSIKVGKAADLVILDKDLYKIPSSEISNTKVKMTMMNGRITYQSKK